MPDTTTPDGQGPRPGSTDTVLGGPGTTTPWDPATVPPTDAGIVAPPAAGVPLPDGGAEPAVDPMGIPAAGWIPPRPFPSTAAGPHQSFGPDGGVEPAVDPVGIPGAGWIPPRPSPSTAPVPQQSHGPGGRILHQNFPGDERFPNGMPPMSEGPVCYPDEPFPDGPTSEGPVSRPDEPWPNGLPPTSEGPVSRPDEPLPSRGPVCSPDDDAVDPFGATTGPTGSLDAIPGTESALSVYAAADALPYADAGAASSPGYDTAEIGYSTAIDDGDAYDLSMDV